MNDLLQLALEAHGGLARWREISTLSVRVALTGQMYGLKGFPQGMRALLRVDARTPHVLVSPFGGPAQVGHFLPDRTWITDGRGAVVEERSEPRASFAGHVLTSRWDRLQLLYFNSYAMWNYLCTPFLLARPGFELRELEPHSENGESWRRLHATFPADVPTHCPTQTFYFDQKGVLQRIDYVTDVAGGVAAHYCFDHTWYGGLLVPTLRRVVRRTAEGPHPSLPTAILIQLDDVLVE